jgi:hypothetical protein
LRCRRWASASGVRELKELVVEASRALARLDADRLEELALSCQALNRDLAQADAGMARAALAVECKEAVREIWRYLPGCWRRRGPI